MNTTLEKLIEIVTREVIKELSNRGYSVDQLMSGDQVIEEMPKKSVEVDMSAYVTPILTEGHIEEMQQDVEEVAVPQGTVITPGAARLVKLQNIKLIYKS